MKTYGNLSKIVTSMNGTDGGDLLSAVWHFLCFSGMAQSDVVVEMKAGKIMKVIRNGVEIEPTVAGLNKAMRLGRCKGE